MGLFSKIFNLCQHKWINIEKISVYETWDGITTPGQKPSYYKYVLKCERCGDIKVKKT